MNRVTVAHALPYIRQSADELDSMGPQGRAHVGHNANWSACATQMVHLITHLQ